MKSGKIELRSIANDRLLGSYVYDRISTRQRAINIWKSRYAHKIDHCYLQIIPDVDLLRIGDDGRTQRTGRTRKYKTVEKLFE